MSPSRLQLSCFWDFLNALTVNRPQQIISGTSCLQIRIICLGLFWVSLNKSNCKNCVILDWRRKTFTQWRWNISKKNTYTLLKKIKCVKLNFILKLIRKGKKHETASISINLRKGRLVQIPLNLLLLRVLCIWIFYNIYWL